MGLTKVSGDVIQGTINVGVVTATTINVGSAVTIHTGGFRVGSSDLHSSGLTVQNLNSTGVVTATTFSGNLTGNVTGNATGLSGTPNITVGAITAASATITGNVSVAGTVTYDDVTNVDSLGVGTFRSGIVVNTGTASTALVVNGSSRITGILSVGQGTITINGNTDKITTPKLDYAGISSTITATATDVFVYDTRKDSDGGAWRKRTQHTSWYNETLNTATRGSRRDFPAVAVIVATTTTVTIYDGDDPDMPMWMVFNVANNTWLKLYASGPQCSCISALNGTLCAGGAGVGIRLAVVNFIKDDQYLTEAGYTYYQTTGIVTRNDVTVHTSDGGSKSIVNNIVNDVAMTVLPNAPIDSTTGLPVPTIAVATQGGISIITDSGTVYNLTPESNAAYTSIKNFYSVGFDSNQKLFFTDSQTTSGFSQLIYLPNYNYNQSLSDQYSSLSGSYNYVWNTFINDTATQVGYWAPSNSARLIKPSVATRDSIAIGYTGSGLGGEGLSLIGQQNNYLMNCGITTTFNTGWLYGYTQGAFLSDTSTTSVTGTNLVTNGDFASGTTGWTGGTGGTLSVTSGVLRVTNTGTNGRAISNTFSTVVGKKYVLTADGVTKTTSNYYMEVRGPEVNTTWASGTGVLYFTAVGTTTYVELYALGSGSTYSEYDNVSVRIVEDDRSVNNRGLAVFGTITKTAVATGADLVAYGGWSSSNYLQQPYNSALNFGTGNFSVMCWIKSPDATALGGQTLAYWGTEAENTGRWLLAGGGSGYVNFYANSSSWANQASTLSGGIASNTWNFIVATRVGTTLTLYLNGQQSGTTGTASSDISNTSAFLRVGYRTSTYNGVYAGTSALLRISASVPSPDQILKIYNDEKALFQENSKATLYGTSSAVTALAYDDSTRLLYAGTSSGRSDFQGLKRINNTTTAVTTAISASNGLVAEQ